MIKEFTDQVKCLVLKYANRATQSLMEIMMHRYLQNIDELSEEKLFKMLVNEKQRKNLRISFPIVVEKILCDPTERNVMTAFVPKYTTMIMEQFDSSNLKSILNNCVTYSGWVDCDSTNGWLQTFHAVAKMRNDELGHNNSFRIRIG